uniref:Uncharacterized protein n=1 Tax=Panagrolaimus sp. JU765 TaxID=591449 RepID=A0AC34Q6A8_9BILA
MDFEADCSVLFERKPGTAKRRKHQRKEKPEGTAIIRKIIRGDNLSEKQSEKISNSVLDGFSPIIPYSLNKQSRWKTLGNVDVILQSVEPKNCIISAARRTQKPSKAFKVDVYGRIKPGNDSEVEKIKCEGNGCVVESLANSLNCLKDGKTKKKDKNVEKMIEPEVAVIIDSHCEDWRLFARGEAILGKANFVGRTKTRRSNKMERLIEEEEDDNEEVDDYEEENDSGAEQHARKSRFDLTDFIVKDSEAHLKKRGRLSTANTLESFEVVEDLEAMIKAIDEDD